MVKTFSDTILDTVGHLCTRVLLSSNTCLFLETTTEAQANQISKALRSTAIEVIPRHFSGGYLLRVSLCTTKTHKPSKAVSSSPA